MSYVQPVGAAFNGGEEVFSKDELFYSRTDPNGVIRTGNAVLQRVCGLAWPELIGAPHKIIRHKDMPSGIFWLMWQTLAGGKPVAAFVKNRSARGGWYWVLLVVVPAPEGYVSVQLKPSGSLFHAAQALYAEALASEATSTPEQSGQHIVKRLTEMGFTDYRDFAARALAQELSARDAADRHFESREAHLLDELTTNLAQIGTRQAALLEEFGALQAIPTNMRIIASRLEPSGGPVSAISDNYKFASAEISRRLEAFAGAERNVCLEVIESLGEAMFLVLILRLMKEMQVFLRKEDVATAPFDMGAECALFQELAERYRQEAGGSMAGSELGFGVLNLSSGEIRRMMLGLDTIRVMGRVESGRLGMAGAGLSAAIDQLDLRHASLAKVLQELMDLSSLLKSAIAAYEREFLA